MQPEVEAAIERALGSTFFLARPTPKRLAAWRARANELAARSAGYAYAAYAHLKIATVVEEAADTIFRLGGGGDRSRREAVRQAIWDQVRARGLVDPRRGDVERRSSRGDPVPARLRPRLPHPPAALRRPPDVEQLSRPREASAQLRAFSTTCSTATITARPAASTERRGLRGRGRPPGAALAALAARSGTSGARRGDGPRLTEMLAASPRPSGAP